MISLISGNYSSQTLRDKVEWWLPGPEGRRIKERYCLKDMEFQFGNMKKFWWWTVVVADEINVLNNIELLKMVKVVNFMLFIFYHNLKKPLALHPFFQATNDSVR